MSSPLNSKDLSSIQGVDNKIHEFLEQVEKGNAPNPNKLLQIEKELKSLVDNQNIPDSVKASLKTALTQIANDQSDLYGAKSQVDQALEQGKLENR